jgi:hypothetical protein
MGSPEPLQGNGRGARPSFISKRLIAEPNGRSRHLPRIFAATDGRADVQTTRFPKTVAPPPKEKLANAVKYFLPPLRLDGVRKVKSLLR